MRSPPSPRLVRARDPVVRMRIPSSARSRRPQPGLSPCGCHRQRGISIGIRSASACGFRQRRGAARRRQPQPGLSACGCHHQGGADGLNLACPHADSPPSARDLHWHSIRVRMRISSAARRGAGNLNLVRPHADATISAEPTTSTSPVRMRTPQSARCRRIQPEPSACGRNHRLGRFRAHRPTPSACGFFNDRDVGGLKPEPARAGANITGPVRCT